MSNQNDEFDHAAWEKQPKKFKTNNNPLKAIWQRWKDHPGKYKADFQYLHCYAVAWYDFTTDKNHWEVWHHKKKVAEGTRKTIYIARTSARIYIEKKIWPIFAQSLNYFKPSPLPKSGQKRQNSLMPQKEKSKKESAKK